jgi:hypothetical protein
VVNVRSMRIYDRWGSMVFENTNFTPNEPALGWDGRAGGDNVLPGVYVYAIELEFLDGTMQRYDGDVTVVR